MPAFPLLAALFLNAGAGSDAAVTLGRQKQLFLDDYLLASTTNVKRRIHQAEKYKGNPVIRQTEPWEDPLNILYGSVIHDEGKYRAWYMSGHGVSYAESDDGITWVKPRLDLVTIDGAKTNVLFRKNSETSGSDELPYYQELFGVHQDLQEPDPSRRYKMGFLSIDWKHDGWRESPFHKGQRRGLGVAASPDGIHWKLVDNFASEAICDGATHWMFDPVRRVYVLYGRTLKTLPDVQEAWSGYYWYGRWHSGRAVARLESADFATWNFTEPLTAPVVMTADLHDEPGTEIYSMNVFPYESAYIGLVQVFHSRPDACTLDVQLAVSRDGMHFTRVGDRSPILTVGGIGSWDRFNQSLANNPPIVVGDELRIYHAGRTYRHSPYSGRDTGPRAGGIGFATLPRDRFVSLEASFDGGEIVTRPLKLAGTSLHLNAKSDSGEIVIEVFAKGTGALGRIEGDLSNEDGVAPDRKAPVPLARSRPIRHDSLDSIVEWAEGGLDELSGPVVLRITLKNARLYALWCS